MTTHRILIVDDEPNLSDLIRLVLEKTGRFEVLVENRSAQALSAAQQFRPDLILLDVNMPGKDGGQVALEIGGDAQLRDVPILFCTSLISRAEAGACEAFRGGKRYLAKPVNPKVLITVLDRILGSETHAA